MKYVKYSLIVVFVIIFLNIAVVFGQDTPLTIGFAQVGSESAWRNAFTRATIAEAEARGINLLFSDGENNQVVQIAALRSFIEQGVDAILLAPVVETGWDEVLREVHDAGIPLVVIDRNVTTRPDFYLTRVASDFVHEGRLAAAWLAQATAGECNIIELEGTVGSSAARDRQIGFNDVIELFPNMQILISQSGDFQQAGGREVMEGILSSEDISQFCAVWAHNDDMAIGAVDALKAHGIDPGDDILIVSVDAVPDIFLAMMNGDTNATVELSLEMAASAFDAINAHLAGEDVPRFIPVPGGIFFPDTAEEEYARRTE